LPDQGDEQFVREVAVDGVVAETARIPSGQGARVQEQFVEVLQRQVDALKYSVTAWVELVGVGATA